jgi:hypothetical protein
MPFVYGDWGVVCCDFSAVKTLYPARYSRAFQFLSIKCIVFL